KPATREHPGPLTTAKAWRVDDRAALLDRYAEALTFMPADAVFIQEFVPGGGEAQFSYSALCLDGRPLASITARRTRQYPMHFGRASTYVESIDEPALIEPSVRLLEALGLTGLFEIEFKLD